MDDNNLFFIGIAVAFIVGVIAGRVSKSTPEDYSPPDGAPARLNPVRDATSPGCKIIDIPRRVRPSVSWPNERKPGQRVQTQTEVKSVVERGGDAASL